MKKGTKTKQGTLEEKKKKKRAQNQKKVPWGIFGYSVNCPFSFIWGSGLFGFYIFSREEYPYIRISVFFKRSISVFYSQGKYIHSPIFVRHTRRSLVCAEGLPPTSGMLNEHQLCPTIADTIITFQYPWYPIFCARYLKSEVRFTQLSSSDVLFSFIAVQCALYSWIIF